MSEASAPDPTLPDREAVKCMVKHYQGVTFPQPEGMGAIATWAMTFRPPAPDAAVAP